MSGGEGAWVERFPEGRAVPREFFGIETDRVLFLLEECIERVHEP